MEASRKIEQAPVPVDVVIPVYNERLEVVRETVRKIRESFGQGDPVTVVVVNDGSKNGEELGEIREDEGVLYCEHPVNQGYGAALKTGILAGTSPWIAIVDADSTYPVERLPELVTEMKGADMVIGTRTGELREIPWLRRFPKHLLNRLASYMAGVHIADLNSGMRVFSRDLCHQYWGLYPQGFSFTSTITMGAILGGYRLRELPIDYYKRSGKSSIRPIHDTLRFVHIIVRMGVLFHPMKLFGPIAFTCFAVGAGKGFLRDFFVNGYIGNLSIMLMLVGIQIILMGYIGELIVKSRTLARRDPGTRP